jgi:hypothetical protein
MGIILFIVAVLMALVLYPLGLAYAIIKLVFCYVSALLKTLAISIDRAGNVVCAELFNDTLIKGGHRFGNPNETVSRVLGMNKKTGTLTKTGTLIANFLNWLDDNHVEESTET